MAVASAGPYANLHLAPERQPLQHPTTHFLQARRPSCHQTDSVKALKATVVQQIERLPIMHSIWWLCQDCGFGIKKLTSTSVQQTNTQCLDKSTTTPQQSVPYNKSNQRSLSKSVSCKLQYWRTSYISSML